MFLVKSFILDSISTLFVANQGKILIENINNAVSDGGGGGWVEGQWEGMKCRAREEES